MEVLVVGAGPTGLFLALELHKQGIPFRIIDRKEGPSSYSKALGYWPRTLECFETHHLVAELLNRGHRVHQATWFSQKKELGTLKFDLVDSTYPFALMLPQSDLERVMLTRLHALGLFVEWNTQLVDFTEVEDGVIAVLEKEKRENFFCSVMVACDGSKSFVRQQLGIPFQAHPYHDSFVLMDAIFEGPFSDDSLNGFIHPEGLLMIFPLPDGVKRILWARDKVTNTPPTAQEALAVVEKRTGEKIQLKEVLWLSLFGVAHALAEKFIFGRCCLAGDAAHVHSPAGGQGANTGMQDAFALGWRLKAIKEKRSSWGALLKYQEERQEVARQVIALSDDLTKMIEYVGHRSLLPQNVVSGGLKFVLGHLFKSDKVRYRITNRLAQLSLSYRKCSTVETYLDRHHAPFRRTLRGGDLALHISPLLCPDLKMRSLIDLTQDKFTLWLITSEEATYEEICQLHEMAARKRGELPCFLVETGERPLHPSSYFDPEKKFNEIWGVNDKGCFLIRPDRYLSFVSNTHSFEKVQKHISNQFGYISVT